MYRIVCLWVCTWLCVVSPQLETLAPLEALPCMGYLNIAGTNVPLQQLLALRSVHLLELHVGLNGDRGCSVAVPELTPYQCRLLLVHLLPRVWVIDGVFVTQMERWMAQSYVQAQADRFPDIVRWGSTCACDRGVGWSVRCLTVLER